MERQSLDFGLLLKKHAKQHKQKPAQFQSIAGGVRIRLEKTLKSRKSNRLTIFDSIRNLSRSASPVPVSEAQQKLAHRLQQLERWKEEKEKKKKEAAAKKRKPFLAGLPHSSHKYVPAPLPPVKTCSSGRVTRSQTARNNKSALALSQSFAPKNATFKPPVIKNNPKVPTLAPPKRTNSKITFNFEPILPKTKDNPVANKDVRPSRSRVQIVPTESKVIKQKAVEDRKNAKTVKTISKAKAFQSSSSSETDSSISILKTFQSSSSSETESSMCTTLPTFQIHSSSTESESSSQSSSLSDTKDKTLNQRRTRQSRSTPVSPPVSKTPRKSILSSLEQKTPTNQVPKSESSSEERLKPKSPLDRTPEQIIEEAKSMSPYITMSRGKHNASREMKKKIQEGFLDEDASDVDNIDHFRRQLATEIERMSRMCQLWDRVLEQTTLPDSIQESILAAVGQCRLLMSQKLQQFAGLVERCARPEPGAALVTPADLHGFWDMVFMQIENVDVRFKKLEELRARGWAEERVAVAAKKKVAKAVRAKPVAAASRIKEMIAAARKAKKDQLPVTSPAAEKSFEAGFFSVTSPIRSPAPATPRSKCSLLKAVLSSEASKSASKNSASFAMLRASVLGKSVECDGVSPLPQTPTADIVAATPGRSILKKAPQLSTKKSLKVVLFDKSDDESSPAAEQPGPKQDQPVGDEGCELHADAEEKENIKKTRRLTHQDAIVTPMVTRSQRKSMAEAKTPQENKTPQGRSRRSTRKTKILTDVNDL